MTYKVGDKLKWRGVFDASMYTVGKVYEIAKEYRPGHFYITDDNESVETTRHTWPGEDITEHFSRASIVRTRREIVPGDYDGIVIHEVHGDSVDVTVDDFAGDVASLRRAAALFTEMADVLAENGA